VFNNQVADAAASDVVISEHLSDVVQSGHQHCSQQTCAVTGQAELAPPFHSHISHGSNQSTGHFTFRTNQSLKPSFETKNRFKT